MRSLCALLLLSLVACGAPEEPTAVAAVVRVDGLLRDDVSSLNVFVFGPRRTDDVFLTCSNLIQRVLEPTDPRVDLLGRVDVDFDDPAGRETEIKEVPSGEKRLVYVGANDLAGTLIANGCTDTVTVPEGGRVDIEVRVYTLQ